MGNFDIQLEELHPTYREIARIIGLDNAIKLGREIGGEPIYLPRLDGIVSPFRKERDRRIVEESKNHSVKELSRKYRLTQRQIYTIINQAEREKKSSDG